MASLGRIEITTCGAENGSLPQPVDAVSPQSDSCDSEIIILLNGKTAPRLGKEVVEVTRIRGQFSIGRPIAHSFDWRRTASALDSDGHGFSPPDLWTSLRKTELACVSRGVLAKGGVSCPDYVGVHYDLAHLCDKMGRLRDVTQERRTTVRWLRSHSYERQLDGQRESWGRQSSGLGGGVLKRATCAALIGVLEHPEEHSNPWRRRPRSRNRATVPTVSLADWRSDDLMPRSRGESAKRKPIPKRTGQQQIR